MGEKNSPHETFPPPPRPHHPRYPVFTPSPTLGMHPTPTHHHHHLSPRPPAAATTTTTHVSRERVNRAGCPNE